MDLAAANKLMQDLGPSCEPLNARFALCLLVKNKAAYPQPSWVSLCPDKTDDLPRLRVPDGECVYVLAGNHRLQVLKLLWGDRWRAYELAVENGNEQEIAEKKKNLDGMVWIGVMYDEGEFLSALTRTITDNFEDALNVHPNGGSTIYELGANIRLVGHEDTGIQQWRRVMDAISTASSPEDSDRIRRLAALTGNREMKDILSNKHHDMLPFIVTLHKIPYWRERAVGILEGEFWAGMGSHVFGVCISFFLSRLVSHDSCSS